MRPICKSNMKPEGLVGPNNCNIEPETVQLTCSVDDNDPVEIHWLQSGYNKVISGNFSRTNDTSVLSMKADLHMDRRYYACIVSTSTSICTTDILKILC